MALTHSDIMQILRQPDVLSQVLDRSGAQSDPIILEIQAALSGKTDDEIRAMAGNPQSGGVILSGDLSADGTPLTEVHDD